MGATLQTADEQTALWNGPAGVRYLTRLRPVGKVLDQVDERNRTQVIERPVRLSIRMCMALKSTSLRPVGWFALERS
jgi:hypothetical protein